MDMLWRFLRLRWWLIAVPVVVVILATLPAIPAIINPDQQYTATIRFTAAASADAVPEETYEDSAYVPWLASEYVVVNLPQWVTSDSFAEEVSNTLDLNLAPDDLRPAFNADSGRSVFVLFINWDDEDELERIAEAAITVLQTRNQIYFPQFAAVPAEVVPWDNVRVTAVPPPLFDRFAPLLRIGIALAAGLLLALAVEFFDPKIYATTDLEGLELDWVAVIPKQSA